MDEFQSVVKSLEWHLGWWDVTGEQVSFQVWYHLQKGAPGRREVGVDWPSLDDEARRRLRHLIAWCLGQFPEPNSYEFFGKTVRPTLALDVVHFPVFGETENRPNSLSASTFEWHPDRKVGGPHLTWAEAELPPEIRELARSFDEQAWTFTRESLLADFGEDAPNLPDTCPPLIYVAYRDDREESRETASRLNAYFISKRLRTFFAPWSLGWGTRLFDRMREKMAVADAAVLCYTDNFLEGKTAREEYDTFCARLEEEPEFRAGLVLIDVPFEAAPEPLRDRANVQVSASDGGFDEVANTVYRGVLGLGQEPLHEEEE